MMFHLGTLGEYIYVYTSIYNFMKLYYQIKKLSTQELEIERSVCITVICYSGPISAISKNASWIE